ncbi:MAG: MFS transporter, partial [Alphaproteobacteria bacterium]
MSRPRWTDFSAIRRVFTNRNYAIYTAGNAVSLTGLWVQRLAVGWLAWELTHSGFWLGAVAFADLFPVVLIGPFAGALADRMDRVRATLVCQTLSAVQAAGLAALTLSGLINIEVLFALTLLQGILIGLNQPVRLSLVPSLVRGEDLTAAISINSIVFNVSRFIGPGIAGVLLTTIGAGGAFAFNSASYLAMIAALLMLRLPPRAPAPPSTVSLMGQVAEGIRYVVGHPGIGPILLVMMAGAVLCRPVIELLPGLTEVLFGGGPAELAVLTSATGVGAILGGIWIAQRGTVAGLTRITLATGLLYGAAVPVVTIHAGFAGAVAIMTVIGFAFSVGGIATQTLLQVGIPDNLRGRVMSLYGLIFRGGPAVGALAM